MKSHLNIPMTENKPSKNVQTAPISEVQTVNARAKATAQRAGTMTEAEYMNWLVGR